MSMEGFKEPMAHVPEDARAELEQSEIGQADTPLAAIEVPDDVKAEIDAEARARVDTPGDDAQRTVPLEEIDEQYRG
jgi:hypothetical protein